MKPSGRFKRGGVIKGRLPSKRAANWNEPLNGKRDAKMRRAKLKRVSRKDRETAAALRLTVKKSTGGILVAAAAPPTACYLRIRSTKTGEILGSIPLTHDEAMSDRIIGAILRQRAAGFDPRETHIDDRELEAYRRPRLLRAR